MTTPSHGAEDMAMPVNDISFSHDLEAMGSESVGGVSTKEPSTSRPPHTDGTGAIAAVESTSSTDRLLSIYNTASGADRFALTEIAESYFRSTIFRGLAVQYIQQNPSQPFRLMNLPTEIRLMIARHVLQSSVPLCFQWLHDPGSRKRGTFESLHELTAVTRVCKQLRGELSDMVWKVNTFRFSTFSRRYREPNRILRDDLGSIAEAVRFFVGHAQFQQHHSLVSVEVKYTCKPSFLILGIAMQRLVFVMSDLQNLVSNAQWKIYGPLWTLSDDESELPFSKTNTFNIMGKMISRELKDHRSRNWRIFPDIDSENLDETKRKLCAAGVEEAEKWIDEGL